MVGSILATAAYPKYIINTRVWNAGESWTSATEMRGYLWLRYFLKPNTKVFAYVGNEFVLGHDMYCAPWAPSYQKAFKGSITFSDRQL